MTKKQTLPEKELRQFNVPNLELRKAGEGDTAPTTIIGYAVEWDKLSDPIYGYFQEQFRKGAFANSLKNDDQRALWQHNVSQPLGRRGNKTLTLEEDDTGLRYEITVPNTTWGQDALESVGRGDVTNSSFLFRASIQEWDDTDPDMSIRTVTEAQLFEVSPVTFPAYSQSSADVRSAQDVYNAHKAERVPVPKVSLSQRRKLLDLQEKY